MAAIYSNGGNRSSILGFNFTKRDALSSLYKIPMPTVPVGSVAFFRSCSLYSNLLLKISPTKTLQWVIPAID